MRILHLPTLACNQPYEMSRGLRAIGLKCDYMILDDNDSGWVLPGKPDYNLNIYHRKTPKEQARVKADVRNFFISALFKYDVFHYHSNLPIFENFIDLKILKFFGKKIAVSYWGEIRTQEINSKYKYSACQVCKIGCQPAMRDTRRDIFAKYADLLIAQDHEISQYAPPGFVILPSFVNTSFWQPSKIKKIKKSKTFKIFHSFGNSELRGDVKGTKDIVKAVKRLKREGYNLDFMFFDKVNNSEIKNYYQEADLVVEQLRAGTHGTTALEAMSMAKPVISYIRPEIKKAEPDTPIINANLDNFYEVLKWAITHRKKLLEIGQKSRNYVVKNRDSVVLAKRLYQLYKTLY